MIFDTLILNVLTALFSVLAVLFIWLAVYLVWNIIKMAEFLEKKPMGSKGILLALPLGLATPIIVSYYMLIPAIPPLEMRLVAFFSLLAASLLLIRPVLALLQLGQVQIPKLLLAVYAVAYAVVNMLYIVALPLPDASAELVMLAAELVLGASFILLSAYTSNFKELKINIGGKPISTRYELSYILLIAGLMVPLDATLMKIGVYTFIGTGNVSMDLLLRFRFLTQFILVIAGGLALLGMMTFKKAVEDFCCRFGSMNALINRKG